MRLHKLVEMIKTVAREKEERRLEEARVRATHHSTKYRSNKPLAAKNHAANVQLAETESEKEKKKKKKKDSDIKSTDEVDHRPDVIDTSPTLNTIAQSR